MPPIRMIPAAKISASCQVFSPPFPVVVPSVVAGPELTVGFGVGGAPRVGACCALAGPPSASTSASTAIDHPTRARIAAECSPLDAGAGRGGPAPDRRRVTRYAHGRHAAQAAPDQGRAALRAR